MHILDFLDCPDKRLADTFANPLAREHGLTRLEGTITDIDLCTSIQLLEQNKSYLSHAPFYSVSFSKQWLRFVTRLTNSLYIFNRTNNLLHYVYWVNSLTKKITGLEIDLNPVSSEKYVMFAMSAFGFNGLPINLLEITTNLFLR